MKYAWVEAGVIRDMTKGDPAMIFHPDVAAYYSQQVPNAARVGDAWDGTVLTPKVDPVPVVVAPTYRQLVSHMEFQFLFTAAERNAISASNDVGVVNVRNILADTRTNEIDLTKPYIIDYFELLETLTLVTKARKNRMLSGRFPRD